MLRPARGAAALLLLLAAGARTAAAQEAMCDVREDCAHGLHVLPCDACAHSDCCTGGEDEECRKTMSAGRRCPDWEGGHWTYQWATGTQGLNNGPNLYRSDPGRFRISPYYGSITAVPTTPYDSSLSYARAAGGDYSGDAASCLLPFCAANPDAAMCASSGNCTNTTYVAGGVPCGGDARNSWACLQQGCCYINNPDDPDDRGPGCLPGYTAVNLTLAVDNDGNICDYTDQGNGCCEHPNYKCELNASWFGIEENRNGLQPPCTTDWVPVMGSGNNNHDTRRNRPGGIPIQGSGLVQGPGRCGIRPPEFPCPMGVSQGAIINPGRCWADDGSDPCGADGWKGVVCAYIGPDPTKTSAPPDCVIAQVPDGMDQDQLHSFWCDGLSQLHVHAAGVDRGSCSDAENTGLDSFLAVLCNGVDAGQFGPDRVTYNRSEAETWQTWKPIIVRLCASLFIRFCASLSSADSHAGRARCAGSW